MMRIAYVMTAGHGDTDILLATVVHQLQQDGWRTSGVVQINTMACDDHRCDMDVKILPDGATIRISQTRGKLARGCRLNPSALEQAVVASQAQLAKGTDVLIVNKFGKHEANGRGFRDLIAEALSQDIPVIVGMNKQNLGAFLAFAGDLATEIAPEVREVISWVGAFDAHSNVA